MFIRKLIYKKFYYALVSLLMLSFTAATTVVASNKPVSCPDKNTPTSKYYAYCGAAKCTPDTNNQYAMCKGCIKLEGDNLGTTTCKDRAPKGLHHENQVWTSSWSMDKDIEPHYWPLTICSQQDADQYYADCLDAKCHQGRISGEVDCRCKIFNATDGDWVGQVHNCNEVTSNRFCQSPDGNKILNGAPLLLVAPLLKVLNNQDPDLICTK